MVHERLRRGERRRRAARRDHRGAALLHDADVLGLEPAAVDDLVGALPADLGVGEVGVERRRVVAPDRELLHVAHPRLGLCGEERARTVVVEPRHRAPSVVRDRVGICVRDQAIGIARIADDDDAHPRRGVALDRLSLFHEDRAVLANEIAALHARTTRHGPDQQHPVRAMVRLGAVRARDDAGEQRKGAVLELHERALGLVDHLRDVREAQVDLGLGPEHLACGDARQERVGDLSGRSGDDDAKAVHFLSSAPP